MDSVCDYKNIENIKDVRNIFPVTKNCVYLDSAHYSQFSIVTVNRMNKFINDFTYTNVDLGKLRYDIENRLKSKIANLIECNLKDVIITVCTTHGMNIFANGLQFIEGECVAYPDTEFPAIVYTWMNQEKLRGVKNIRIPSNNGKVNISDIENVLRNNNVKVLTVSSVGFLGFRNDLKKISGLCRSYNCMLMVDAIQSMGICPFSIKETDVDFVSSGAQKWLQSPSGIGFAYISSSVKNKIFPTYAGTTNVEFDFKNFLNYNLNFRKDGGAYENSAANHLGMIALESSLDLFLKLGVVNIYNHILGLLDIFIEGIKNTDFIIESDLNPVHRSNILIFSHSDKNKNEFIQKKLDEKKIHIALRENFLRLSPHIFNNENDIDILIENLLLLKV